MQVKTDIYRRRMGALGGLIATAALALMAWGLALVSSSAFGLSKPLPASLGRLTFTDIKGKTYGLQDIGAHKASVFLFVSSQCPISNVYTPRMQSIASDYAGKGVEVFAIYSDCQESREDVVRHVKVRRLTFPAIKDERNVLADRLGAAYTPEAIVVDSTGVVRYRGRIDDNAVATKVISHDLVDALNALLTGKPILHPEVAAFGCAIRRAHSAVAV